ncbi:DNA-binding transcriptional regulator, MarR family [Desulfopila aestuarii DSM 18488]|uniref:DNA-binding transcriptional regulator, MarR family n=2 Tax=Desulfopila aestuarii TaxID=231440 RepID=A0A1M7Y655_9BACT|nr:DNA-binding transcriptional regulator, MarR family [Desulfopila aestuarii DSM 18488]
MRIYAKYPMYNMDDNEQVERETPTTVSDNVLISLRRIIQAIDLHSRQLVRQHGITTPQLIILKQIHDNQPITVSKVAKQISLKQATVTDILNRLEKKGLVQREKDTGDRRQVLVKETDAGKRLLDAAPSPLQETFLNKFENLEEWQKHMILSSLQLLGTLMTDDAVVTAAPILSTGILTETIENGSLGGKF